jgi:hypothetical protein
VGPDKNPDLPHGNTRSSSKGAGEGAGGERFRRGELVLRIA